MVLECVPPSLRGELTRWMLELRAGVFVGTVTALVRDTLWKLVREKLKAGAAILVYSSNNEQGFKMEFIGPTSREITDFDGLCLIRRPREKPESRRGADSAGEGDDLLK
jgi:CRISPR-associated protein Cas2